MCKNHNFAFAKDNQLPPGILYTNEQVIRVWKFTSKFQAIA